MAWWESFDTQIWIFSVGRGNAAFVRTGLNLSLIHISIHAGLSPARNADPEKQCSAAFGWSSRLDIHFPANYRLRSAPSVNSACAAPRGIKTAVLASAPLAGFGS